MFKVLVSFKDLKDKGYRYNAGDEYPRKGLNPSSERISELSSKNNRRKTVLIEEIIQTAEQTEEPPKKKSARSKRK